MARASRLQQELRQTKPFQSLEQEAFLSILKTADLLRRQAAATLSPFGITNQQYNVLRILRGAGEEGLPTLSIGERLIEEAPGMTRMLDRLESRGWVRRVRCDKDRRLVRAFISAEGLKLLSEIDKLVEQPVQCPFHPLDAAGLEALIRSLDLVRAAIPAGFHAGAEEE